MRICFMFFQRTEPSRIKYAARYFHALPSYFLLQWLPLPVTSLPSA